MRIAVEGCCHGELDKIYETVQFLETSNNFKVDLLLICGDFQAVRNMDDLSSMAVPPKYQKLNTFYKYYAGLKVAPVLTIFIGGNHEASNYMQELPYGGWVAKNIYYMGYANVIEVGGLRIGGLSGIYKEKDFYKGHHEFPPYTEETKRSVYHVRNIEVFRLKQLTRPLDIFMSHDWPTDVARYGNMNQLFSKKPFLRAEVMDGTLGSPPAAQIMQKLQPTYWFSAHLHVKFSANIKHPNGKSTRFLSLDKCLPRRQFLQVVNFEDKEPGPLKIKLDPEWLCVLKSTNHLMHLTRSNHYMPGPHSAERSDFEVQDADIAKITELFGGDLSLPENFKRTAPTFEERKQNVPPAPPVMVNEQTALLCTMLELKDPNAVHLGYSNSHESLPLDPHDRELLSNQDDDAPTDMSSSASFINSSVELSSSFSSTPATVSTPVPQVADDDEEFLAILAAQRESQQVTPTASGNVDQTEENTASCTDKAAKRKNIADNETGKQENSNISGADEQEEKDGSLEETQKMSDTCEVMKLQKRDSIDEEKKEKKNGTGDEAGQKKIVFSDNEMSKENLRGAGDGKKGNQNRSFPSVRSAEEKTSAEAEATGQRESCKSESAESVHSSSPKVDSAEDEPGSNQPVLSSSTVSSSSQRLEDGLVGVVDRSYSDIESTSQDSQDDSSQLGYQGDCSQTSVTDCLEVSTGSDSPVEKRLPRVPVKHSSPSSSTSDSPSMKKLKRRNISVYTSSGTEDDFL